MPGSQGPNDVFARQRLGGRGQHMDACDAKDGLVWVELEVEQFVACIVAKNMKTNIRMSVSANGHCHRAFGCCFVEFLQVSVGPVKMGGKCKFRVGRI